MNSTQFFELNPYEIEWIPFDIETTGFKSADDEFVTTFILHHTDQYHIWINVDGDESADVSEMTTSVEEMSGFSNIVIHLCQDEEELLRNVGAYLSEVKSERTLLTAFNGETYNGRSSFDVPFLRTRCLRTGVEWIMDGFAYTDLYEVVSMKNRFDTNVKDEPSLDGMKRADLEEFTHDVDLNVHPDKMSANEIQSHLESSDKVTLSDIESWAHSNNKVCEDTTISNYSDLNKSDLQKFIDSMDSVDISYDKLKKSELIQEISTDPKFTEDLLVKWHEQTGRNIGKKEVKDLDGVHKVLFEDRVDNDEWHTALPFTVEVFEPFDPFESSGEAVTQYLRENYADVIGHCLADVARTVNLARMVTEYAAQSDYRPTTF